MQGFPTGFYDPRTSWSAFLMVSGAVLTMTFSLLAPQSSGGVQGVALVVFWAAHIFSALAILQAVQLLAARAVRVAALAPWLQVAGVGVVGAMLFTPLAMALDALFAPMDVADDLDGGWAWGLISEFAALAPVIVVVWLGLNGTRLLRLAGPAPRTERSPMPAFWQRVPIALGRDLVALSAELHYLRVRTTRGDCLVLSSFGRALADLDRPAGVQIHRSHWVALEHVVDVRAQGQRAICMLSDGATLPVSRSFRPALRAAMRAAQSGRA